MNERSLKIWLGNPTMKSQTYWYLGFLGAIGIYRIPKVWAVFVSGDYWLELTNLLWFLWFLYFIPETEAHE